jgi:hypothetical protein
MPPLDPDDDGLVDLLEDDVEGAGDALEDKAFSDDLTERVLDGASVEGEGGGLTAPGMPPPLYTEPTYAQPVNQATMECLRGPCIHHWTLVGRFVSPGKDVEDYHVKNIMQCNCHTEETSLNGQNIYHCTKWWPGWLAWVPESAQGILRPRLRAAFEFALKAMKYDFSWRFWPDDFFRSDRPSLRGDSGIGGARMHLEDFRPRGNGKGQN